MAIFHITQEMNFKKKFSPKNIRTVFWVLLVDFLPHGKRKFCNVQPRKKLRRAIQHKRRYFLNKEIVLLHDNAVHTAIKTQDFIRLGNTWSPSEQFRSSAQNHHLFLHLKTHLGDQRQVSQNDLVVVVVKLGKSWLYDTITTFFFTGFYKYYTSVDLWTIFHANFY